MNKNLFFLCFSTAVIALSIICITIAPIINKNLGFGGIDNCKLSDDKTDIYKSTNNVHPFIIDKFKDEVSLCNIRNAMHDLEYTAFIMDIFFGFICFLLALIHYFDAGKNIEKYSGLIGFISGIIICIMTIIYVGFSAYIFSNDIAYKPSFIEIASSLDSIPRNTPDSTIHSQTFVTQNDLKPIQILYPNKAVYHWNGQKYIHDYDESDKDYEVKYIKYKDLGKKQYNYDSEIFQMIENEPNSEVNQCVEDVTFSPSTRKTYNADAAGTITLNCDYIWNDPLNKDSNNKYLYDRWLTNIILSVIVAACGIAMALFGFFLFLNKENSTASPELIPNS